MRSRRWHRYYIIVRSEHKLCIDTVFFIFTDEAIKNISAAILDFLGEDTVLVVSSDNGASPWEGGMNAPFRGGKYSPFEGGVKVPAFLVDYSMKKKYFGQGGRSYDGLIHISDWFPTLLTIAGMFCI